MSSKPLTIYKHYYSGICSSCNSQKILYKIVDCVHVYCLPCWRSRQKGKKVVFQRRVVSNTRRESTDRDFLLFD